MELFRSNKKLKFSIRNILNFKYGAFPFKYLGVLISPKHLAQPVIHSMLDKINSTISFWNHSRISKAGKTILINSSVMSTSLYYLSVYLVLDYVLDGISKAARSFFWAKGCNRKCMNSESWIVIMLDRAEGGLSIQNLCVSKTYLMAKNVFKYLNKHDSIWVDILYNKYGSMNF